MYMEWNEHVFKAVQSQIDAELASRRTEDIEARRRELMDGYLRVLKRKEATGGVYRDIIIESEYDPLQTHEHTIRYQFSDKQDPLKAELRAQSIGQPKPRQVGRTTLPSSLWQKERFSDTYGRFDRVYPEKPPHAMRVSHVPMEHYSIARGADVPREFPKGKKVDFPGTTARDMRQSQIFAPMEFKDPYDPPFYPLMGATV